MSVTYCVSVLQPWATLILAGAKHFETRGWRTAYRGRLAVQAGRRFPNAARALCRTEPFRALLRQAGFDDLDALPLGVVLGSVEVVECCRVEDLELAAIGEQEQALGDFRPARWAWQLRDPRPLAAPVSVIGKRGVFPLPESVFLP
jgi:hypothetical protein